MIADWRVFGLWMLLLLGVAALSFGFSTVKTFDMGAVMITLGMMLSVIAIPFILNDC